MIFFGIIKNEIENNTGKQIETENPANLVEHKSGHRRHPFIIRVERKYMFQSMTCFRNSSFSLFHGSRLSPPLISIFCLFSRPSVRGWVCNSPTFARTFFAKTTYPSCIWKIYHQQIIERKLFCFLQE